MKYDPNDPRLTAYVLDELSEDERREIEKLLESDPQARRQVEEIRQTAGWLTEELQAEPASTLSDQDRDRILQAGAFTAKRGTLLKASLGLAAAVLMGLGIHAIWSVYQSEPSLSGQYNPETMTEAPPESPMEDGAQSQSVQAQVPEASQARLDDVGTPGPIPPSARSIPEGGAEARADTAPDRDATDDETAGRSPSAESQPPRADGPDRGEETQRASAASSDQKPSAAIVSGTVSDSAGGVVPGAEIEMRRHSSGASYTRITDDSGRFQFDQLSAGTWEVSMQMEGFRKHQQVLELKPRQELDLNAVLEVVTLSEEIAVISSSDFHATTSEPVQSRLEQRARDLPLNGRNPLDLLRIAPGTAQAPAGGSELGSRQPSSAGTALAPPPSMPRPRPDAVADDNRRDRPVPPPDPHNTESYQHIEDNPFRRVDEEPLSTFSIDVDTASYSNLRRFINAGTRPPKDAVRIEEMINYFRYSYAGPDDEHPFAVRVETARAPWRPENLLLRVGLKGKEIPSENRPPSNLVFLLDVSGSMASADKLPLLKKGMKLLVENLAQKDRVAIVVYAGAAGLVLPSTSCDRRGTILAALERLGAGGSTAGAAGIQLAYKVAQESFIEGGINRVILATDGDFNIGLSSQGELVRLIEEKRASGVFLSVLGFGTGNLKDDRMESLADAGNGNYAYIDTLREARKVLVEQIGGTLMTIAKDVKIQVEFNPQRAAAYRLIGYENRLLAAQDFNDDAKDAGEIGAGHSVTALYEIIPAGGDVSSLPSRDPLRYQRPSSGGGQASSDELLMLKLRYKRPQENESRLMQIPVRDRSGSFESASEDFRFAAAVAAFGMILRDSPHKGSASIDSVREIARKALGEDPSGHRAEFLYLVNAARPLLDD